MFEVELNNISMVEGEFGNKFSIFFEGFEFRQDDTLALRIFKKGGTTIVEKIFHPIVDNEIELELTEEESQNLPIGEYRYEVDWCQDGVFQITILRNKHFWVVEKRPCM